LVWARKKNHVDVVDDQKQKLGETLIDSYRSALQSSNANPVKLLANRSDDRRDARPDRAGRTTKS